MNWQWVETSCDYERGEKEINGGELLVRMSRTDVMMVRSGLTMDGTARKGGRVDKWWRHNIGQTTADLEAARAQSKKKARGFKESVLQEGVHAEAKAEEMNDEARLSDM